MLTTLLKHISYVDCSIPRPFHLCQILPREAELFCVVLREKTGETSGWTQQASDNLPTVMLTLGRSLIWVGLRG